jgi:hypothetical protein
MLGAHESMLRCNTSTGISLRKRNDWLEVSRITLEISVDLALKMFAETGDLPVAKYPALEEPAELIAEVLNTQGETRSFAPLKATLRDIEKPKQLQKG